MSRVTFVLSFHSLSNSAPSTESSFRRNHIHGQGSTSTFHRTPPTIPFTDYAATKSPVLRWTWRWRRQQHPPESQDFPVVSRRHPVASLLGYLGQAVFGTSSNVEEATVLSLFGVLVQLLNNNQHSSSHWILNHPLGVAESHSFTWIRFERQDVLPAMALSVASMLRMLAGILEFLHLMRSPGLYEILTGTRASSHRQVLSRVC